MFDSLSDKLSDALRGLSGQGKIREKNIQDAVKKVRMSLLEADVNFRVAKEFVGRVKEKALGEEVLKSVTPSQQFVHIVYSELTELLGSEHEDLNLSHRPPVVIMMVGLQGAGKTTTSGKLARYLRDKRKRTPLLVPVDTRRPAAIDQLTKLGSQLDIEVYPSTPDKDPVDLAMAAVEAAPKKGCDTVILDTAGRLAIDEELMGELKRMHAQVQAHEILFVADSMTGQDAVSVAKKFNEDLPLSGVILTKVDGDARGGAALSIKSVTGRPIKFVGLGEKLDALEPFYPDRMAQRILGMGDVVSLVEKASEVVEAEDAQKMAEKIKKAEFTLEDFLSQMQALQKMGSLEQIMGMIPGMGQFKKMLAQVPAEKEMKKIQAIIQSMTPRERNNHKILNGSRRRRIASGSGTKVNDVNQLIKQFEMMRQMMKRLNKGGMGALRGLFPGM
jgi:signal recognition particle subunit SRP54